MIAVRPAEAADRAAWTALWLANCAHYGHDGMTAAVIDGLWQRILDPGHPMDAWLARDEAGSALGLAHTILHPHTFTLRTVCFLEDLWVAEPARGRGVGRRLIEHLRDVGRARGWRRLYWETTAGNIEAQRLYDRLAERLDHVLYRLDLDGDALRR